MKVYHVDSFTGELFRGNPAGVCLLGEDWLPEETMRNIAMENNLSETAFVIERNGTRSIRWFTPVDEVPLCGHATLAAAHVLFNHEGVAETRLCFKSARGDLFVERDGDLLVLDFPRDEIYEIPMTDALDCFNYWPVAAYRGTSEYLLVFENEDEVRSAVCDLPKASLIDLDGFIITAKASDSDIDFVSRYFSPKFGLNEDPVTGSAHTLLVPYWQSVMQKNSFSAAQVSKRGGLLFCTAVSDRIKIGGRAVTYLSGEIFL